MTHPRHVISMVHDEHHQARLGVRGEVSAETVRKLRHHLEGLLKAGARFIVVDLTGTAPADPLVDTRLLGLLGRTQRMLTPRKGMITMTGIDPLRATTTQTSPALSAV